MRTNTKKYILENADKRYTVIAFDLQFGRRESTYGNLNMIQALNEVQTKQKRGLWCYIFDYVNGNELDQMISRDLKDYMKFMGGN
jgi:hypothetical protein